MSDLFNAYKKEVRLNLKRKIPFGEHQRIAFQAVVVSEIERLRVLLKRCVEVIEHGDWTTDYEDRWKKQDLLEQAREATKDE